MGGRGRGPREGSEAVAVAGNQLMGGAAVGTPKAVGRVGFHTAVCAEQLLWVGHPLEVLAQGLPPTRGGLTSLCVFGPQFGVARV